MIIQLTRIQILISAFGLCYFEKALATMPPEDIPSDLANVVIVKELKNIRDALRNAALEVITPNFSDAQLLFLQFAVNYMRLVKREIPAQIIQAIGTFDIR